MIPPIDSTTGYLPPGIHEADWREVASRFGGNEVRDTLLQGLLEACQNLAAAGCAMLLLDGSFVTAKLEPGDYDGVWETHGVNENLLDPVFLDDETGFASVRDKYLGDLFPAWDLAQPGMLFHDFFQTDRDGVRKGVVLLNLRTLP